MGGFFLLLSHFAVCTKRDCQVRVCIPQGKQAGKGNVLCESRSPELKPRFHLLVISNQLPIVPGQAVHVVSEPGEFL